MTAEKVRLLGFFSLDKSSPQSQGEQPSQTYEEALQSGLEKR